MADRFNFRGKRIDNGEWIIGHYVIWLDHCCRDGKHEIWKNDGILDDDGRIDGHMGCREVDPATVGQSTGLCDKNGVEIFEGDIVKDSQGNVDEIKWKNGAFYSGKILLLGKYDKCEVVGNVHENPDLLKEV